MGDAPAVSNLLVDRPVEGLGTACSYPVNPWGQHGDTQNSSRGCLHDRNGFPFPSLWIEHFSASGYPQSVSNPYRITVICLGNICRSPIGEAVLRDRIATAGLAGEVAVDSAGTGDWHIGQGANVKSITTLNEYGYALDHTARQITPSWFANIDLALVMDTSNYADVAALIQTSGAHVELRMMRAFDPALRGITEPDPALDVPDPYHGTMEDFVTVLRMIEAAAAGLVSELPLRVS